MLIGFHDVFAARCDDITIFFYLTGLEKAWPLFSPNVHFLDDYNTVRRSSLVNYNGTTRTFYPSC
jgi:hypothetical protein